MEPKAHTRDSLSTLSLFALALLLFVATGATYAKPYLVLAREVRIPPGLEAAVNAAGGVLVRTIPQIGLAVAESSAPDFAARLEKAVPAVRSVVPDMRRLWIDPGPTASGMAPVTNNSGAGDPLSLYQWGLEAIDAFAAHAAGATGSGVVVAVVDTGIDDTHPDLGENYIGGYDFVNGDDYPMDDNGHGTHVAGIIAAAENGVGVVGVAPLASLMAVKVLDENGAGWFTDIFSGIVYAADNGADVINMSLGAGGIPRKGFSDEFGNRVSARDVAELMVACNRATGYAYTAGVTIIVAAGNEGMDMDHCTDLFVLAQLNHVLAVSATAPELWALDPDTNLDVPACYTNYGQSTVHVAAPGGDYDMALLYPEGWYDMVLSCVPAWFSPDGYAWACGTSMAAPHAAGVAALLIGRNGGPLHPALVKAMLQGSADDLGKPGQDDYYGAGRINAFRAAMR